MFGDFAQDFGRCQDEAHRGVVWVTSHGRAVAGYLSAPDLEHFGRLKRREREVLVAGTLPGDVAADIEAAEYGAGPECACPTRGWAS